MKLAQDSKVEKLKDMDMEAVKKATEEGMLRRELYNKPFWFPLNMAQDLIIYKLDLFGVKGLAIAWLDYFIKRAEKRSVEVDGINGRKKVLEVDLAEARWESQSSIAKALSTTKSKVTKKNIEYLESVLRKREIIISKTSRKDKDKTIRFVSVDRRVFLEAKAMLTTHPQIPTLKFRAPLPQNLGNPTPKTRDKNKTNKNKTKEEDREPKKGSATPPSDPATPPSSSGSLNTFLEKPISTVRDSFSVGRDIERLLFRKNDSVPIKEINKFYKELTKLTDKSYQEIVEEFEGQFGPKHNNKVASQVIRRDYTWGSFFNDVLRDRETK